MSWLFSRALVAASSVGTSLDGEPSVPSSGSPTPLAYLQPDRTTAFSRLSRFGVTFAPLTESLGRDVLTWCLEDSLARTSALPARAPGSTASAAECGSTWPESLARFDPASCSWRTPQLSLLEGLDECLETWPRSGLMLRGECYPLKTLEHPTDESEFGSLPTPSGTSNHGQNHVMGRLDEWGGSSNPLRGTEIGRVRCASFEEWMMGWPMGWSALTPSATARCPSVPLQPSVNSPLPLLEEA
jgi:hypothetical protein